MADGEGKVLRVITTSGSSKTVRLPDGMHAWCFPFQDRLVVGKAGTAVLCSENVAKLSSRPHNWFAGPHTLYWVDLRTRAASKLLTVPGRVMDICPSPRGSWLAVCDHESGSCAYRITLWRQNGGTTLRPFVYQRRAFIRFIGGSPDDRYLYFVQAGNVEINILSLDARTGRTEKLRTLPPETLSYSVTMDTVCGRMAWCRSTEGGMSQVEISSLSGNQPRQIQMQAGGTAYWAFFSPSGRYLAWQYHTDDGERGKEREGIAVVDLRTERRRDITVSHEPDRGRGIDFSGWHPAEDMFLVRSWTEHGEEVSEELRSYSAGSFVGN